ncbi:MAG: hypothetical protein LBS24_04120 [Clostridiales Family XIII bacterium]|nr:hypothetical protein [Clostridiales Family XIII bacterium]
MSESSANQNDVGAIKGKNEGNHDRADASKPGGDGGAPGDGGGAWDGGDGGGAWAAPKGPTGEAKIAFDERMQRVEDALALKEPDRVPCMPFYSTFPYIWAGYTIAEVMYDDEKAQDAIRRYVRHFEPDMSCGYSSVYAGQGPLLDKLDPTWLEWAGKPNAKVDKNSICQYIEFPFLEEDEDFSDFNGDMGGWIMRRYMPKAFRTLKGLEGLDFRGGCGFGAPAFTMQFLNPAVAEAFKTLTEAGYLAAKYYGGVGAFNAELEAMGFPLQIKATTTAAFDSFSNNLRGTLLSLSDILTQPADLKKAVEQFFPGSLFGAVAQAKYSNGKFIFIPMHKGMDGFMSGSQYKEFYWDPLKRLVMALIEFGYTPWLYTEGKYDSRLEYLADLPDGKVWVHFENADMKEAKRIVGPHACISGGIRADLLMRGTADQVKDEVKRNMDICAPGGGYIFDFGDSLEYCKPENVEAVFETVKLYGKYR